MGLPAGFKPNPNLDNFLGNLIIDLIHVWNIVTTELTQIESFLVKGVACFGCLGVSFQLAIAHDMLFFCSTHIFFLYSCFASTYKFIIQMMITLIRLFGGRKYNVIRKRVDSNNF